MTEPDRRWGAVRLESCPEVSGSTPTGFGAAVGHTYHRRMERLRERRDLLAVRRLDLALGLTAAGLVIGTIAFLNDPSLSFALLDRSTDVSVN